MTLPAEFINQKRAEEILRRRQEEGAKAMAECLTKAFFDALVGRGWQPVLVPAAIERTEAPDEAPL